MQHHPSGVLWMIQHSAGDLAVPKWTKPNTAAVMQASTWVAPLTTVSVRVSCNYVLLNWSLLGNSPFAPHGDARSATEQLPGAGALLNDVSAGQIADDIGTYQLKRSRIPKSFTPLVINMVTNESNLWSQSVTNKIILSRGRKLISIHLGHSSVAFKM